MGIELEEIWANATFKKLMELMWESFSNMVVFITSKAIKYSWERIEKNTATQSSKKIFTIEGKKI